jgi:hypothetical protein
VALAGRIDDQTIPTGRMTSLPARTRIFPDGEYLLRAGDDDDSGFLIAAGTVELSTASDVLVGTVRPGEVVGGVALLFGLPQEYDAIAAGAADALPLDRAAAELAMRGNPAAAHDGAAQLLAKPDFSNLLETHRTQAGPRHDCPLATPGSWADVWLRPGGPEMNKRLPGRGVAVREMPFVVGRVPARGEQMPRTPVVLTLPDARPFNLSRSHFSIETDHAGLLVRDVGSQLSTAVNGLRIGLEERENTALLHIGANEIVAGGAGTPFRFVLDVAG